MPESERRRPYDLDPVDALLFIPQPICVGVSQFVRLVLYAVIQSTPLADSRKFQVRPVVGETHPMGQLVCGQQVAIAEFVGVEVC